jgi:opacity protein-like surface antigen
MKVKSILLCVVSVALAAGSARAIDRGATMIDKATLDMARLDEMDSIGASVWGEAVFAVPQQDWSLLFGGGLGTVSPDYGSDVDFWHIALGVKFYVLPVTSLSAMGDYSRYDALPGHRDAKALSVQVRHRFLSADAPISPYALSTLTVRSRSTFSDPGNEGSFSEVLFNIGGGVEFTIRKDLSFAVEVAPQIAKGSQSGAEDLDGALLSVSMVYYWDEADR